MLLTMQDSRLELRPVVNQQSNHHARRRHVNADTRNGIIYGLYVTASPMVLTSLVASLDQVTGQQGRHYAGARTQQSLYFCTATPNMLVPLYPKFYPTQGNVSRFD